MRRALVGLAVGLVLPLSIAHADVSSDLKVGQQPIQTVLINALKDKVSIETALRQVIEASPDQAYAAITAALQLSPDQAADIVSVALSRQYNLNPPQVVAAALQGAPEKSGVIVPTAIVRSPGYFTVPIVTRALSEGVDGDKFIPQAIRTAPRQADSILTQALRSAPHQANPIMTAVIKDQPDKATHYVRVGLDAKKESAGDILAAAFKAAPRQAEQVAAIALEKGVPKPVVAGAASVAGVEVASLKDANSQYATSNARQSGVAIQTMQSQIPGGGGGCTSASCN